MAAVIWADVREGDTLEWRNVSDTAFELHLVVKVEPWRVASGLMLTLLDLDEGVVVDWPVPQLETLTPLEVSRVRLVTRLPEMEEVEA